MSDNKKTVATASGTEFKPLELLALYDPVQKVIVEPVWEGEAFFSPISGFRKKNEPYPNFLTYGLYEALVKYMPENSHVEIRSFRLTLNEE